MASIEDCPFCAIGKKYPPSTYVADSEDPTYIVLAAAGTIAFLDRLPLTKCHTLVIPRGHYELLSEFPSDVAADVGRALPIVCRAVLEVSGADAFNVVQNNGISLRWLMVGVSAGQVVPHAHFHIVPRFREHNSASMFGMISCMADWRQRNAGGVG
jgi:histidine triad (HIT) family protein